MRNPSYTPTCTRDPASARRTRSNRSAYIWLAFNGQAFPFDPFELRALDVAITDDMLLCLDALRWAKADLYKLVPDGERRILAILQDWGLEWLADER